MSVKLEQPVPFQIPEALDGLIAQAPTKDRARIREAVRQLHEANGELWAAEDKVRTASDVDAVALKRSIDQLNRQRNELIERIDEGFTHLAAGQLTSPGTPVHTETLGSAIDRLSVVTLREQHADLLSATAGHEIAADRLPAIRAQRAELTRSIADLAAELHAGVRRLPDGRKFKLYGNVMDTAGCVTVSPNIEQVIALGGLSECGKSSSGEYLRYQEGTYRLKMSFLIDLAARRGGVADPYQLDRRAQARLLLEGLNVFADMHVDARRFTIESVHSDELILALKQMLDDRLQIVYLEAPAHVRAARSHTNPAALCTKDAVKVARGAHRVAAGADHRIDNGRAVIALHARLRAIANKPSATALRVEPASSSFLPGAVAELVDEFAGRVSAVSGVDLLALTGSAVDGEWFEGWSDVDLLISAKNSARSTVVQAGTVLQGRLQDDFGIKCAISVVTPGEVDALLVQPRVIYALSRLAAGRSPALYAVPDLHLPRISDAKLRHAATADLPLVIVTLRRLLAQSGTDDFDIRAVFKHVVLALRLLLRCGGVDVTGADAIVDAAEDGLPELGSLNLPMVAALATACAQNRAAEHVAAVVHAAEKLLAWYARQTDVAINELNPEMTEVCE